MDPFMGLKPGLSSLFVGIKPGSLEARPEINILKAFQKRNILIINFDLTNLTILISLTPSQMFLYETDVR